MNIFRILVIIALVPVLNTNAQEQAREIILKSHEAVKVSSFEATSTLTITDGNGNQRIRKSTMASKVFPDGTEKRIIKFLSPPEVKGTGILIFDYEQQSDDMWVYLPALRKTRRIVSGEKSKAFMGSEFSNADMTAPGIDDFSYEILGEETIDGQLCWKIRSVPAGPDQEDEYGYAKSISFISKNGYIVRETRYFDYSGELFKIIKTEEITLLDEIKNKSMITRMSANNLASGRNSEMVMDKVAAIATSDAYFTVAYLEK